MNKLFKQIKYSYSKISEKSNSLNFQVISNHIIGCVWQIQSNKVQYKKIGYLFAIILDDADIKWKMFKSNKF